eukprot:493729_1
MAPLLNIWMSRGAYLFAFLITICILGFECKKRLNTEEIRGKSGKTNQLQNILNVFSLLTLIFSILHALFLILSYIPRTCLYSIQFGSYCVIVYRVFLSIYQIVRLQILFQQKTNVSGYPKLLFIILYICGAIFLLSGLITFLGLKVIKHGYACSFYPMQWYSNWILYTVAAYYVWDMTVLTLYIIKIIQIKSKLKQLKSQKNGQKDIMFRLGFVLNKVITLTVIYEIQALISATVNVFMDHNQYLLGGIRQIILSFDPIMVSVCLYLMIETNNKEYVKMCSMFSIFCKSDKLNKIESERITIDETPTGNTTTNTTQTSIEM